MSGVAKVSVTEIAKMEMKLKNNETCLQHGKPRSKHRLRYANVYKLPDIAFHVCGVMVLIQIS